MLILGHSQKVLVFIKPYQCVETVLGQHLISCQFWFQTQTEELRAEKAWIYLFSYARKGLERRHKFSFQHHSENALTRKISNSQIMC